MTRPTLQDLLSTASYGALLWAGFHIEFVRCVALAMWGA